MKTKVIFIGLILFSMNVSLNRQSVHSQSINDLTAVFQEMRIEMAAGNDRAANDKFLKKVSEITLKLYTMGKYLETVQVNHSVIEFLEKSLADYKVKNKSYWVKQTIRSIDSFYSNIIKIYQEKIGDVESAIMIFQKARRIYGNQILSNVNKAGFAAAQAAAAESFIAGDFEKTKTMLALMDSIFTRRNINFERKIMEERAALGNIQPEFVQTILVLVFKKTKLTNENIPGINQSLREAEISEKNYSAILKSLQFFKRVLETLSKGKLSVVFKPFYVDATVTQVRDDIQNSINASIIYSTIKPYPANIFYENIGSSDVIFSIYNMPFTTYCWGGTSEYPVIPYHINAPRRGMSHFNYFRGLSLRLTFHEYFHTCERLFKFHSQDDFLKGQFHLIRQYIPNLIRQYFPNYDMNYKKYNNVDWDYYSWQFSVNIPRILEEWRRKGNNIGWKQFSFSSQNRFKLTAEKFKLHSEAVSAVSVEARQESYKLKNQADDAWKKGNKTLSDTLYVKALQINPALYDAFRYLGIRAAENKNYSEAVRNFELYLRFITDANFAGRTGNILLVHLNDREKAKKYYRIALENSNNEKLRQRIYAYWTKNLLIGKHYGEINEVLSSINDLPETQFTGEILFNKGIALFYTGDKDSGLKWMKQALTKGAEKSNHIGWTLRQEIKNAVKEKNYSQAANFAEIALSHRNSKIALESGFHYGYCLFHLGNKKKGVSLMKQALMQGLKSNNYFGYIIRTQIKEYMNSQNFSAAVLIASVGVMHTDLRTRNDSVFYQGESLYRLGKRDEGIALMKSVLSGNNRGWFIRQFKKITGLRYP